MDILNKQSGFQGITGVPDSRDVETLFENGDLRCKLAIDMFCYRYVVIVYVKWLRLCNSTLTRILSMKAHRV